MRLLKVSALLLLLPLGTYAQNRLHGHASGSVYLPIAFEMVPDVNAQEYDTDFGWPELDVNVYYDILKNSQKDQSFLSLYVGGNYRSMFGLEEEGENRDFDGSMSSRQIRAGLLMFNLVRVSYVRAGIGATGTSEALFQTYSYGGPVTFTNGFEIGLEASRGSNSVGLYFQNSLNPPAGENVRAVEWSTFEGRVRSTLLDGDGADGFVQFTVGYDVFNYDDREVTDNRPMDFRSLRLGLGIGVAF